MKYIKYLFAFLFLLFCQTSYGQYFNSISLKDGLTDLSVLSINQDKLGRMWFGTNQGINIYDGETVLNRTYLKEKYPNSQLLNGRIKSLVSNTKGDIFFCNEGQVIKYDIELDKFHHITFHSKVRQLFVSEGNICVMKDDSLFMHHTSTDSLLFKCTFPVDSSNKNNIVFTKQGNKIYYGNDSGLYVCEGKERRKLSSDIPVTNLYASSLGELWIGTERNGLYRMNKEGVISKEIISPSRLINNRIRTITEDSKQNIWIGTFKGLQMYNPYTDNYKTYTSHLYPGTLSHESVFSLFYDNQSTLWIGTYYGGVNFFHPNKKTLTYYPASETEDNSCINHAIIGDIVEGNENQLWIGTDGKGLNCLDRNTGLYTYYNSNQKNSFLSDNIKTLAYDKERQCLYIGTHLGGFSKYDTKTKKFHNYLPDTQKGGNGPSDIIFQCTYRDNYVYVTARNGFWKLDVRTDKFEFITRLSVNQEFALSGNYAWINIGLSVFRVNLVNHNDIICVLNEKKAPKNTKINHLIGTRDGKIYIATNGKGIYVYDSDMNNLGQLTTENSSILSNYCYRLTETKEGRIAITTDEGFSIYSPQTEKVFSLKPKQESALSFSLSSEGKFSVTSDSTIFLSGINGMVSFDEKDFLKEDDTLSNLHFSELFINNHFVYPLDETGILKKALPMTSSLDLKYNQNNVTILFSNPTYIALNKSTFYSYKLEGFDKEWIVANSKNITYTNLPQGKYTLKVQEKKNILDKNTINEISLNIVVHRPWFFSIGFILLYIVIISIIVYMFWRMSLGRKMLAFSLQKEKEEKERMEHVNKMKLTFFTNISHEFRTPLSLILAQIEMLLQIENSPAYVKKRLNNLYKNAAHLRLLINELLDFRKQEQGFLKIKVERVNAVSLVNSVFTSFTEMAQNRNINYNFVHLENEIYVWIDPIQMQKVIFNLISNAFKYTENGHEITVSISTTPQQIKIAVKDTGIGISPEVLPLIFNRFFQVEENDKKGILGTGLGLALAKGIVEAHHGTIEVESTKEKGSEFSVLLKTGNTHFQKEELNHPGIADNPTNMIDLASTYQSEFTDVIPVQEDSALENDAEQDENRPKILVVEDNQDMLEILKDIFSPSYNVITATDGQSGLDEARKEHPDLIVSDVMMPVMSGKEMCYRIKNNLTLAYIPIALLTAQTSDEHQIEGYMFGADDYITKPFNVKLLLTRCNTLIKNRQKLLDRVKENTVSSLIEPSLLTQANQELINKATQIIKDNFSNTDFNMNALAFELHMGRNKMYTCIKEATGLTPNELMLKLKFEEALRLLKEEPSYNITEISFQLGFVSPPYFTRCFKSFYGVSPQTFRKNLNI